MVTARELRTATPAQLRQHIQTGHPVDPDLLDGWLYRGTSLGLPSVVERLTWKTFQKAFWRDPASGRLLGWNVRLQQDGIDAPSRPRRKRGRPVTEWYYEVVRPAGVPAPPGFDRGLIIDYARGPNPPGLTRAIKDPLVSLLPDNSDQLLGVSYLVVAGHCLETPTYFTLEREQRITEVPAVLGEGESASLLRLTALERRWAEELFGAILGVGGGEGLPAFETTDRTAFWRCFDQAPAPLVRAGLRPMLHTLTFLPLVSGFGRPFFKLATEDRERFLEGVARDERYFVRQSLVTLKTLACLAYFDDAGVRGHFESPPRAGGAS